jgi:isopentenyldiphosphate isomerase
MSRAVRNSSHSILYTFCCTTDCDKTSIRLQEGETVGYRWVSEEQLQQMIAAGELVPLMKHRLDRYFQYLALQSNQ